MNLCIPIDEDRVLNSRVCHDTGEYAVNTIRTWWREMGKKLYPNATSLLITADGGSSNGYRLRL